MICFYQANPCLLTVPQILVNELSEFVKRLLLVLPVRVSAASKERRSVLWFLLDLGSVLCSLFNRFLNTFPTPALKSHGTLEMILHLRLILWIYLSGGIPSQQIKDVAF